MKNKKGMSMALTIVVSAVVLIVVSLVIITVVTGGLGKFSLSQDEEMNRSASASKLASAAAYCRTQKMAGNCEVAWFDLNGDGVQAADNSEKCSTILGC